MCGFDLLEDEAVVDHHVMTAKDVLPTDWVDSGNPGFAYYSYYVYANLVSLNYLRRYMTALPFSRATYRSWNRRCKNK